MSLQGPLTEAVLDSFGSLFDDLDPDDIDYTYTINGIPVNEQYYKGAMDVVTKLLDTTDGSVTWALAYRQQHADE